MRPERPPSCCINQVKPDYVPADQRGQHGTRKTTYRPSTGAKSQEDRTFVWKYGARTGPYIFEISCGPTLPGSFRWSRHKTSYAKVTWDLPVDIGPLTWGDVGICGPWKVRTKSHSCIAVVTCVLLVTSALWPQNNVKPYYTRRAILRMHYGIGNNIWSVVRGSKGPVLCSYMAHRNHKACEPLHKATGKFTLRAGILIARHVTRAFTTFCVAYTTFRHGLPRSLSP